MASINTGLKNRDRGAVYLEPWHTDTFLEMRNDTEKEEAQVRDFFYGLLVPDPSMRRVTRALHLVRCMGGSRPPSTTLK